MAHDDIVDQFFFDHYLHRCLNDFKDEERGQSEKYTAFLKDLLDWSISPSYPGNRFKANLLIITCYQLELKEIGLEESLSQLDDIRKTEVLKYLVEIQRSTDYLHQHATSSKLVDICRQCLFHICAKFVEVFCKGETDGLSDEDSQFLQKNLEQMKKLTNFQCDYEKEMFRLCKKALSKPPCLLDLPPASKLWSLVKEMIFEAMSSMEAPCECVCQLKHKIVRDDTAAAVFSDTRDIEMSYLLEIMGMTAGEAGSEQKLRALREKCERIKQERRQICDVSERSIHPAGKTAESRPVPGSSSKSPHREQNKSKKYPVLQPVKARTSLLSFCPSKKPPSHLRVAAGRWSPKEEEKFIVTTLKIGEGNWNQIKTASGSLRSSVQLKDKWRQLSLAQILRVANIHQLSYSGRKIP